VLSRSAEIAVTVDGRDAPYTHTAPTKGTVMEVKLISVYRYCEKTMFSRVILPRDSEWAKQLQELIPRKQVDNKQVAIFSMGKDSWGHECRVAAYFHDFNVYLGSEEDVRDGDMIETYKRFGV